MLKRNLMIGVLVIATALASSAFTLVSFGKSAGLPIGQPVALAIIDKGERDNLSLAASPASLAAVPVITDKGERDDLSQVASLASLPKAPDFIDKGERDFADLSLSASLAGISNTPEWYGRDSLSPSLSAFDYTFSPYLIMVGPYIDDHYPVQSGFYLVVLSAYHDR